MSKKIKMLEEGTAKCAMTGFLTIIKSHRGLTRYLEDHGVNGIFLQPDKPYDIPFSKFSKILELSFDYSQTVDNFSAEWNRMNKLFCNIVKQ